MKGKRTNSIEMPATRTFRVDEIPKHRPAGVYASIFEELKTLAETGEGKVISFPNRPTGVQAVSKMRVFAREDGYQLFHKLDPDSRTRWVWARKGEAEFSMRIVFTLDMGADYGELDVDDLRTALGEAIEYAGELEGDFGTETTYNGHYSMVVTRSDPPEEEEEDSE